MSYSDLLDRMKGNDTEAFLEMTDRYGWAVYSAIREKYSDHAMADKVYNETMNTFYHCLSSSSADDPLEALLCTFADYISAESLGKERSVATLENMPPKIQLRNGVEPVRYSGASVGRKGSFWYGFGVLLVLLAIAAVLWCILGLLMDMNFIPYYDLGYSWFNAHVMHFF